MYRFEIFVSIVEIYQLIVPCTCTYACMLRACNEVVFAIAKELMRQRNLTLAQP